MHIATNFGQTEQTHEQSIRNKKRQKLNEKTQQACIYQLTVARQLKQAKTIHIALGREKHVKTMHVAANSGQTAKTSKEPCAQHSNRKHI